MSQLFILIVIIIPEECIETLKSHYIGKWKIYGKGGGIPPTIYLQTTEGWIEGIINEVLYNKQTRDLLVKGVYRMLCINVNGNYVYSNEEFVQSFDDKYRHLYSKIYNSPFSLGDTMKK